LPFYKAEIYTKNGEKKILRREATGENELLRELSSQGSTVVSISEETEKRAFWLGAKKRKLTLSEQQLFCTTVCSFMRSGLPLVEILNLLQKQTRDRQLRPIYIKLREYVEGGRSLAASMMELGVFRESLVGMVESGEKSASLADLLERAAELLSAEISLRWKIKSSLTYPLLMLFVGLAVVIFLLSFVVPKLTEIVVQSGAELPFITKLLIVVSKVVRVGIIPLIAAAVLVGYYYWKHDKKIELPFFKDVKQNLTFAMIFTQVGTLIKAGMPLVQALILTAPLDSVSGRLENVAGQIKDGYRFSQGLENEGSFPEQIVTVVRVGESGADLPGTLLRLGTSCWEYAKISMERLATLAEPAIILVMGVLVGFVVIAVLLPIFDLSSLAGM